MITVQSESWETYYADPCRASLWEEHYKEFEPIHENKLSFEPDVDNYRALAAGGMLEVVTARKDGIMIGYCLAVVRRHMHYRELCAFEDAYFVTADERGKWTGAKLIKHMMMVCRKRGAIKMYWMTKMFNNLGLLFSRLGMEHQDEVYTCWLQEEQS
jgi:GNAT superfamily N-acetyltransferase